MTTTPEALAAAVHAALQAWLGASAPGARLLDDDPDGAGEEIAADGQVHITMADGGFSNSVQPPYYTKVSFEVQCIVVGSTADERRTRLRKLLDTVQAAYASDRTFGGLAIDCDAERLDPDRASVPGGSNISAETVLLEIEFQSLTRI